jgi:hypothetical protein
MRVPRKVQILNLKEPARRRRYENRNARFWNRLENARSFVLSELQRILFVSQNRLEIAEQGSERENFSHKDWLKVLD